MDFGRKVAFRITVHLVALSFLLWAIAPLAGAIEENAAGRPTAEKGNEPLQGEVEETGIAPSKMGPVAPKEALPTPVLPKFKGDAAQSDESSPDQENAGKKPLRAKVERSQLKGQEEMGDEGAGLTPMTGKTSPQDGVLKGSARKDEDVLAKEDPDSEDEELQIEWDKWRNRFLRAVLAGAMENLNNPEATDFRWDPVRQRVMTQFPLGTIAWFACKITNDKHISSIRLMQSSGYPNYDRAVLNAVQSLDGTSILRFPSRSHRTQVSQAGGVKTSDQFQQQYFKFGDVEHVRVPAY
jgi:hypothetical protein